MEIRRFFVSPNDIEDDRIYIRGEEFLHMTKVLRYKTGYWATVCANDGIERICKVESVGRDCAVLHIESSVCADRKRCHVTLYAGLLKNNKLDITIQKAVELGVDKIIPFVSENCAESKFSKERAQKIALEAAKQCGSAYLTEICDATDFSNVAASVKDYDAVYFAYEGERALSLGKAVIDGRKVALVIGPEGGFSKDECEVMVRSGAKSVTLGRRILRAETAGIVGCALLLQALGELDYD